MSRKLKKNLVWAADRAEMLLVRNRCPREMFHGVLNPADVRALRILQNFARQCVVASKTRWIASSRYSVRPVFL